MRNAFVGSVIFLCTAIASAGVIPSATFIANWNGNTGNSGLDADYSLGGVGVMSVEGTPGPSVIPSGMNGTNAVNLTDVSPKSTSSSNPTLAYSAHNVVDSNAGTVMFWVRHGTIPADDEIRYFYTMFPANSATGKRGSISLNKHSSDSLDRLYLTIGSSDGTYQYAYIQGGWSALNDRAYHHVSVTWDNTTNVVGMYIHDKDGQLQKSQVLTINDWSAEAADSSTLFYVADNDFHARGANGVLDDYVISSKALTLAEVESALVGEAVPEPATLSLLAVGAVMMLKPSRR